MQLRITVLSAQQRFYSQQVCEGSHEHCSNPHTEVARATFLCSLLVDKTVDFGDDAAPEAQEVLKNNDDVPLILLKSALTFHLDASMKHVVDDSNVTGKPRRTSQPVSIPRVDEFSTTAPSETAKDLNLYEATITAIFQALASSAGVSDHAAL